MQMINQLSSNLKTTLDAKDMLSLSTEIIKQGYQSNMAEKLFPGSRLLWRRTHK